jgi:hypothetical protein
MCLCLCVCRCACVCIYVRPYLSKPQCCNTSLLQDLSHGRGKYGMHRLSFGGEYVLRMGSNACAASRGRRMRGDLMPVCVGRSGGITLYVVCVERLLYVRIHVREILKYHVLEVGVIEFGTLFFIPFVVGWGHTAQASQAGEARFKPGGWHQHKKVVCSTWSPSPQAGIEPANLGLTATTTYMWGWGAQDASVMLAFGRRYGLIGRNGTGKTTLLRAMAGHQIKGIPANCQILHVEQEVGFAHCGSFPPTATSSICTYRVVCLVCQPSHRLPHSPCGTEDRLCPCCQLPANCHILHVSTL